MARRIRIDILVGCPDDFAVGLAVAFLDGEGAVGVVFEITDESTGCHDAGDGVGAVVRIGAIVMVGADVGL
jgi:hypothetical protein